MLGFSGVGGLKSTCYRHNIYLKGIFIHIIYASSIEKRSHNQTFLQVNPLRQTVISGEANITRYVSRLFPLSSSYNYEATGTFSSIAETDNLLDQLAAQAASKNNKERQGALRQLNGRYVAVFIFSVSVMHFLLHDIG